MRSPIAPLAPARKLSSPRGSGNYNRPCDAGGLEDHDRQRPAGAALVVVDRSDGGQALPELLVLGGGGDPWPDVSALVVEDGDTLPGGLEVEPPGRGWIGAGVGGNNDQVIAVREVGERSRAQPASAPAHGLEHEDRGAKPACQRAILRA